MISHTPATHSPGQTAAQSAAPASGAPASTLASGAPTQPTRGSQRPSHRASSPRSPHEPARQTGAAHGTEPAEHSESATHSGGGQASGVSGVHSGETQTPPTQDVAAGSPAPGQRTPSQLRVITTVIARASRVWTATTRLAIDASPRSSVTRTKSTPAGAVISARRVGVTRLSRSETSSRADAMGAAKSSLLATSTRAWVTSRPGA